MTGHFKSKVLNCDEKIWEPLTANLTIAMAKLRKNSMTEITIR